MSYLETAKACLDSLRNSPQGPFSRTPQRELSAAHDSIAQMDLEEFANAGLVVRVHSSILHCDVLFVSDNVDESTIDAVGLPIYRAAELRRLAVLGPEPRTLRAIHDVKTVFDGTVADVGADYESCQIDS